MTPEQWDALLDHAYPGQRRAAPPGEAAFTPQLWPQIPGMPEHPAYPQSHLPFEPADAFAEPAMPEFLPPAAPEFEQPPMLDMHMPAPGPSLDELIGAQPPITPEPFAPPFPPAYELAHEFPQFPEPEPFPMIEPYGGLEERLLEPPIFNGYEPPPMPFFQ